MSQESSKKYAMNPQKKRLEQLKKRREHQEMLEKQQLAHNSKSKKKMSREVVSNPETQQTETDVKMSAEVVDYEYSVEEDYEDDEYKATNNEVIKKLLIEEKRLLKSVKLAGENEKKLNTVQEEIGKRYDEFEKCLDEMDKQLTNYEAKAKDSYLNIDSNIQPLCKRWQASQKTMAAVKIHVTGPIAPSSVFGNLAHYGISILRQVLFYMAYCRDLMPRLHPSPVMMTPPTSDSPRTLNSLRITESD
ncbi:hypothetical protein CRE_27807 [Caenorhabditis remanei]|uniref:Uncharacterized protein n=1 Tax=Caenorhabditis remanei TaxID=31234 RepID=E3N5K8_CAERE|nr:hypothetical protein CRE_27807 [Caenorhabditis remanei]